MAARPADRCSSARVRADERPQPRPKARFNSGEGSGWAVFGFNRPAATEAGDVPINDPGHPDRFACQSTGHIRDRGADANAAALNAGALTRILFVIRFFAVLVIASLMAGMTMIFCA